MKQEFNLPRIDLQDHYCLVVDHLPKVTESLPEFAKAVLLFNNENRCHLGIHYLSEIRLDSDGYNAVWTNEKGDTIGHFSDNQPTHWMYFPMWFNENQK